jgi:hypothetical protein
MHKALLSGLLLLSALLAGCAVGFPGLVATGSGRTVTRAVEVADFDTVDIGSAFNVDLQQGEEFKITLRADDNFMPHVRAVKDGNTLRIALDPNFPGARSWKIGTLEARITMPNLRELRLSGGSHGTVAGFTRDLDANLSGGSWLKGTLAAGALDLVASGGSNFSLDGSAQELTARGSGAGRFELPDLRAGNARITLSGGSSAQVNVLGQLDYDLSGGARLEYSGRPRIGQVSTSGGASVSQR